MNSNQYNAVYYGQASDPTRKTYYTEFTDDLQCTFARFNASLIEHFLPNNEWSVLDFGCGQGYLVRFLNSQHWQKVVENGLPAPQAYGVDISEWAITNTVADVDHVTLLKQDARGSLLLDDVFIPEIVFSGYVLEHMPMQNIVDLGVWLAKHDKIKLFIFRVPIPLPDADPVEYWKADDDTHIHIRPVDWWIQLIKSATKGELTCRQILWQCTEEVSSATFVFQRGPYAKERDIAPWRW